MSIERIDSMTSRSNVGFFSSKICLFHSYDIVFPKGDVINDN